MPDHVKRRRYDRTRREAKAARTREDVLNAALALFTSQGYAATTGRDIAAAAGVSLDTVYASVGRKPQVMVLLMERAISGTTEAVPAEQRDYVRQIHAATTAADKIAVYTAALGQVQPRLAPLVDALRQAAATDPTCAALWRSIAERRRTNMATFTAELRATGELRTDLSDDDVADIIWSTNAPEYYLLLAQQGWPPDRYAWLLTELWTRLLLSPPTAGT
jgi:AcrR family transcriptional regulator